MTTWRVTKDIFNTKRIKTIGVGDIVHEVAKHGEVMIVENIKTGERFSIRIENLEAK